MDAADVPVFGFLVLHPAGPILIDTGVGIGNTFIDELYSPVHHDIDEALDRHGIGVEDITTVITSHLHFDHCGQNNSFRRGRRILVQQAEVSAAQERLYTVPEWAFPPGIDLTVIDGDHRGGYRVSTSSPRQDTRPATSPSSSTALTAAERSCAARPHGT